MDTGHIVKHMVNEPLLLSYPFELFHYLLEIFELITQGDKMQGKSFKSMKPQSFGFSKFLRLEL